MAKTLHISLMVAVLAAPGAPAAEQGKTSDEFWQHQASMPQRHASRRWVQPPKFRGYRLDTDRLVTALGQAPSESADPGKRAEVVISIPTPDGTFERFSVLESPVMEAALAERFPTIRTYSAQGIDDPAAHARLDFTPHGFHAQVFSPRGNYFVDPYWKRDTTNYASYYVRDYTAAGKSWACGDVERASPYALGAVAGGGGGGERARSSGATLRKFRLAVAAQGEYTAHFGGTVTGALAGIVTTVNRLNQLYENDLAIRMLLVANNDDIIYTNAGSDPYTGSSASSVLLNQNQSNLDTVIGSANYDIGHLFNDGGGGLASLGVVCDSSFKAQGCTGADPPVGDPFDIDYVAHEIGHQFAAEHTFNGTQGSCSGGNRNAGTAYEPGSGSTILAYAGICDTDNLQPNSDAYFHFASATQILGFVESTATCSSNTATGNSVPTVNAGPDYTIPKGTPFILTASGSDGNGDTLTYCWEERDLGAAQLLSASDNGASPLFRSISPTTNAWRTFPRLPNILYNTNSTDEELPSLPRTMSMRVTVRDNRAGGGGMSDDDMQITVVTSAGPFSITSPNTPGSYSGNMTVTWAVANTHLAPVNATNVNIFLSEDGGYSFPYQLITNTPNDGSQVVIMPNFAGTTNGRIKVQGASNIFFDISNTNLVISASGPAYIGTDTVTLDDSAGNNSGGIDPDESGVKLYVRIQNIGSTAGTDISGTLTSLTATATVTSPNASYPDLASSATGSNSTPFVVSVAGGHACTSAIQFQLTVTSSGGGSNTINFSVNPGAIQPAVTSSFAVAVNIPDNNSAGTNIAFNIATDGILADVDFSFDGSACSTNATSATVGLNHKYVGDLIVKLTSPGGTTVTLISRPGAGGGSGSSGNNFCNTLLNDDGAFTSIQSIAQNGANEPHTGTWLPFTALSGFDGQSAAGTWILNVSDRGAADTGSVHSFSLILSIQGCTGVSNSAPVVDAGTNQVITLPVSNAVLNATVSDDGDPAGITNILWSKQSGPGTVSFSPSATVEDPTTAFSSTGVYVLACTVNDSALTNADTVQVTVLPAAVSNQAPSVYAGTDDAITLPTSNLALNATISDDGLPSGITNILWSQQSGPGTVTFAPSATVEDPTATFPTTGVYVLACRVNDTALTNSDTVQVTVQSAGAVSYLLDEPMNTDPGWTLDALWAFGVPLGGGGLQGDPDPTSGYTGTNVYGYNLAGDYVNNLAEKYLTTPAINCAGYTGIVLSFRRWLGVEEAPYDHAYVRASTDGTNWTQIWANPSNNVSDTAWTNVTYDLSALANNQATVYLRWVMGTSDSSFRYCGWNIDDVQVTGYPLPADTDGDLMPDEWETSHGLNPAVSNAPADDADGDLVNDLGEYIADTVPTNAASFLRASVISNTGPRSVLFGPSSSSRLYTLQYLDNLSVGVWSNVPNQVNVPGDGTAQDVMSDTNAPPALRQYRIGVKLP